MRLGPNVEPKIKMDLLIQQHEELYPYSVMYPIMGHVDPQLKPVGYQVPVQQT